MRRTVTAEKPAGGYRTVYPGQLTRAWGCYRAKEITLSDLRVYLACLEVVARRCDRAGPNFSLVEIFPLARVKKAKAAIRRLIAAGLVALDGHRMEFPGDDGRPIPFPRRMLRHLAAGGAGALIATVFGHLIRCLWLKKVGGDYECRSGGLCKASWVAGTFGIDPRSVKTARAELVAMGWLEPDPAPQWVLNRHGGSFVVALDWPKSPPPPPENATISPPPDLDEKPVPEIKDQEPSPGVSIGDVRIEDLEDTASTLELHRQAVAGGIVTDSEADLLRVLAAAEHAKAHGTRNPCGLFITVITKKLWTYITQEDEDRASRNLKTHRYPAAAHVPAPRPTAPATEDQVIAGAFKGAAAQLGYRGDAFDLLKRKFPEWTRARWEAALAMITGGPSRAIV